MSAALRILCFGALAAGCGKAPAPVEPTVPAESSVPELGMASPDTLEWLSRPPALDRAQLEEVILQAARGVDLGSIPRAPAVGRPGRALVDAARGRRYLDYRDLEQLVTSGEPAVGATGEMLQVHPRLFSREPWAVLEPDGTLTVRFETVRDVPGANLYYGMRLPSELIRLPRYRKQAARPARDPGGPGYIIQFGLGGLLGPKYDAAAVRSRGRGEVVWRVEALDTRAGSSRLDDGTVAFRCARLPCSPEGPFVQLPSTVAGPVVDLVSPGSAVVSWSTDAATAGRVLVIDEAGKRRWFDSAVPGTSHEVEVVNLAPATGYRYYVASIDARGEVGLSDGATLRTAPEPSPQARFHFALLSDSRSAHGAGERRFGGTNRALLVELFIEVLRRAPHFAVFVGDLVDGYTTDPSSYRYELQAWHESVQPVAAYLPIYESTGNHEALLDVWEAGWTAAKLEPTTAEAIFGETVVNPTNGPEPAPGAPPYRENVYSFDYGNAHLAVINSNYFYRSHAGRRDHPAWGRGQREGWVDDRTLAWLDADLASARERGVVHLFVFTHEPAFPTGGHARDGMYWDGAFPEVLARRDRLVRLLGRHRVVALIHGDEHNYSRVLIDDKLVEGLERPFWQIVSGGAGAPYHAQLELPWSDHVRAFDVRQHFVIVRIDGAEITAEAIAVTGEILDRVRLDRVAPAGVP